MMSIAPAGSTLVGSGALELKEVLTQPSQPLNTTVNDELGSAGSDQTLVWWSDGIDVLANTQAVGSETV